MSRTEATRGVAAAVLLLATLALLLVVPGLQAQRDAQLPARLQQVLQARRVVWEALSPSRQQALRLRVADWDALPLQRRRVLRERWQAWRALPSGEQARMRTAAQRFSALPAAEQATLRARFAALGGSERHGWLLGPELGADYPALHPLLMQVPAAEREPLLAVLRGLGVEARANLIVLAQRTAPQQRDALRRGLLAAPALERGAWLQARLRQ